MRSCYTPHRPSPGRRRSRGHCYIRGNLPTIWEEDRSHFGELMRNRICSDYAFRELLFGYYARMYVEQRYHACNAIALCHYKVYMRRVQNALEESQMPPTGRWHRKHKLSAKFEIETPGTNYTGHSITEQEAKDSYSDQGALFGMSWRQRYWIYIKFLMRHRDLPHDLTPNLVIMDEQERALFLLLILLEYAWSCLVTA